MDNESYSVEKIEEIMSSLCLSEKHQQLLLARSHVTSVLKDLIAVIKETVSGDPVNTDDPLDMINYLNTGVMPALVSLLSRNLEMDSRIWDRLVELGNACSLTTEEEEERSMVTADSCVQLSDHFSDDKGGDGLAEHEVDVVDEPKEKAELTNKNDGVIESKRKSEQLEYGHLDRMVDSD